MPKYSMQYNSKKHIANQQWTKSTTEFPPNAVDWKANKKLTWLAKRLFEASVLNGQSL